MADDAVMPAAQDALPPELSQLWHKHKHTVLLLQGGGAPGAYQAGVCAGLEKFGMHVD
jgi:predicted acylesterase/phospholipase RssA